MVLIDRYNMASLKLDIIILTLFTIGIIFGTAICKQGVLISAQAKQSDNPISQGLLDETQLIILGSVLDEKIAIVNQPGTAGPAKMPNSTVFIEKIINGSYAGETISIVDFMGDAGLHKYDRVILFLTPIASDMFFGANDYMIAPQGKFVVDDNLLVYGKNIDAEGMSMEDFENKITDAIHEYSLSNDTK